MSKKIDIKRENTNNKLQIVTSIIAILLILALSGSIFVFFRDISNHIDFTAEMVKDHDFQGGSNTIFNTDEILLTSQSTPTVYTITRTDDEDNIISDSFSAKDGRTFKYLICQNGQGTWNLTNRSNQNKTVDVYFTITDGKGLSNIDNFYYAVSGAFLATESKIHAYKPDGDEIALDGEYGSQLRLLGQPYKVSFSLASGESCVLSCSKRLALYGINMR